MRPDVKQRYRYLSEVDFLGVFSPHPHNSSALFGHLPNLYHFNDTLREKCYLCLSMYACAYMSLQMSSVIDNGEKVCPSHPESMVMVVFGLGHGWV